MKFRMKALTLSLALVAVLGLAGMASAQGYMMGGPGMYGPAYGQTMGSQSMGYWGCGGWGWGW
ncbi:MAG: hypothetical protein Q8O00_06155 [Holophaga sp.]|nr:hypothetical protein [Holophaga sp.]